MNIASAIFSVIVLAGAIQGIIIGILLFNAETNRYSNRLLAILIWLMSLAGLDLYIDYITGWVYLNHFVMRLHAVIPLILPMAIGPLILFYVKSILNPEFRLTKKDRKYFYPVLIDIIPQLTAFIYFTGTWLNWITPDRERWGIFIDDYNIYADIPRWLSLTIYVWVAGKYVADHKWLKLFVNLFKMFLIIWFIYLVPYVIPRYNQWILDTFGWYPVFIPLSILIYWLGIKGYIIGLQNHSGKKKKTQPSLPDQTVQQVIDGLVKAMEQDKLYLDPLLSINQLANHTGVASKLISAVLNQHIGKGFNEYVNGYRVDEVKKKLLQPGLSHLTITGIGMESGFNSQASFLRIFKQQTGMSPSEFRETALKS